MILAEDVRLEVNQRTGRSWNTSEIARAIKAILHDLSKEGLLTSTSSVSLTESDDSYVVTNAKKLLWAQCYDEDAEEWEIPLDLITEDEYRERLAGNYSDGNPAQATFVDGTIYVSPASDDTDYTLHYKVVLKHTDSTTSEFDDEYNEGIIEGVCFKSWELAGFPKEGLVSHERHKQEYEALKIRYAEQVGRGKISRVRYRDI